jgi:uncharacterized peroxidase-related enzyme
MFLKQPVEDIKVRAMYQSDLKEDGFIMNFTRLWAWHPEFSEAFTQMRMLIPASNIFSKRELAVMVCSMARALGDSYCALAWGKRLADASSQETAAAVLASEEIPELSPREAALARWARHVVHDPNATTQADVDELKKAGLSERETFDATVFIALRLAFSTVNDALGVRPDPEVADRAPMAVRKAVNFGRRPAPVSQT